MPKAKIVMPTKLPPKRQAATQKTGVLDSVTSDIKSVVANPPVPVNPVQQVPGVQPQTPRPQVQAPVPRPTASRPVAPGVQAPAAPVQTPAPRVNFPTQKPGTTTPVPPKKTGEAVQTGNFPVINFNFGTGMNPPQG